MHLEAIAIVAKSLTLFSAASLVGLLAQVDAGIWEKSAWLIMCSLFLAGLTTLWRTNQQMQQDRKNTDAAEIQRLRAENTELRRKIHEDSHE